MKTVYFGKNNEEELVLTRSLSHGYKKAVISSELELGSEVCIFTDGNSLLFNKEDGKFEFLKDKLMFVCKEFGVTKESNAKVSIIFCDNGEMIVTLHSGSVITMFDGKMVQPIVGDIEVSPVTPREVLWVNQDTFLGMKNYFGNEYNNRYWQDFEYFFTISGGIDKAGCSFSNIKKHPDEYVDLSLGYVATMQERDAERERQEADKKLAEIFTYNADNQNIEFEETDYDDDDYDDEDDFLL